MEEEQVPHPEAPAEDLICGAPPPGTDDFEINPQADIRRDKSVLSQDGHLGVSAPMTSVSNLLSQALQLYSYIGIFLTPCFFRLINKPI